MPAKNVIKTYVENGYYHLYNRGVNKQTIFFDIQDYKVFLSYLQLYLSPPDLQGVSLKVSPSRHLKNYTEEITLLAYCLMPNHFHLLVKQTSPHSINYFMRSLATKYVMYINKKHQRVGVLFQDTYKAVMVESEEQLLHLTRYIHQNLLDLNPTKSILEVMQEYPYSSLNNYLHNMNQIWVKPEEILGYFSQTNPSLSYQTFVTEVKPNNTLPTNILLE